MARSRPSIQMKKLGSVPSFLDFAGDRKNLLLPWNDLSLLLKIHALILGHAVIPARFLAHNLTIFAAKQQRYTWYEVETYFKDTQLASLMAGERSSDESFLRRWEDCVKQDMPNVIDGNFGREYSISLDKLIETSEIWTYSETARTSFFNNFYEVAPRFGVPEHVTSELLDLSEITQSRKGQASRTIAGTPLVTRSDFLIIVGAATSRDDSLLSRLKPSAELLSHATQVVKASAAAYIRGVSSNLWAENEQCSVLAQNERNSRPRLASSQEITASYFDGVVLSGWPGAVNIDFEKVRETSWLKIEDVTTSSSAKDYFKARQNYLKLKSSENEVQLVIATVVYLKYLNECFGTSSSKGFAYAKARWLNGFVTLEFCIAFGKPFVASCLPNVFLEVNLTTPVELTILATTFRKDIEKLADKFIEFPMRDQARKLLFKV